MININQNTNLDTATPVQSVNGSNFGPISPNSQPGMHWVLLKTGFLISHFVDFGGGYGYTAITGGGTDA